jgi:hypothetical protein
MNADALLDAIKACLERIIPGAFILFIGTMLTLGIGVTWLVEGPAILRTITAGLAQPLRSIVLLAGLGGPLVVLCYSARLLMGYILAHWLNSHRARQ